MKHWIVYTALFLGLFFHGTLLSAQYKIGSEVEKFSVTNYNGEDVSLDGLEDKAGVVVVFLSYKCKDAATYLKKLEALQKHYAPQGYVVLALDVTSEDNENVIFQFATDHKVNFFYAVDAERELFNQYLGRYDGYLPYAFLLHKQIIEEEVKFRVAYMGAIDNSLTAPTVPYVDLAIKQALKHHGTSEKPKKTSEDGDEDNASSDSPKKAVKSADKRKKVSPSSQPTSNFISVTKVDAKTGGCSLKRL